MELKDFKGILPSTNGDFMGFRENLMGFVGI